MSSDISQPQRLAEEGIVVALTHQTLEVQPIINSVKSPKAGAVVLFAGEREAVLHNGFSNTKDHP